MSALTLEEELLMEQDDPAHVSLPTSLFTILQEINRTTKLMERVRT